MWKEFKEFALRGNVVDLAVAVIIGAAFGKITTSLVNDVIMPPLGLLLGDLDFSDYFINLSGDAAYPSLQAAKAAGAVTLNYGAFITTVINFLIIAFVIFMVIRQLNRLRRKEEVPAAAPTEKNCPFCVTAIPLKATRCPHCTSELQPAA